MIPIHNKDYSVVKTSGKAFRQALRHKVGALLFLELGMQGLLQKMKPIHNFKGKFVTVIFSFNLYLSLTGATT
jgi:hypothetical protein